MSQGVPTPPERVRITSTRREAAKRTDTGSLARDLDEQTHLGEVYMQDLMRAQLRLALRVLAFGAVALGGLPLLFLVVPATKTMTIGPIPFPWLVLGILVYPASVIVARYYVRAAERIEQQFSDVVARRR